MSTALPYLAPGHTSSYAGGGHQLEITGTDHALRARCTEPRCAWPGRRISERSMWHYGTGTEPFEVTRYHHWMHCIGSPS